MDYSRLVKNCKSVSANSWCYCLPFPSIKTRMMLFSFSNCSIWRLCSSTCRMGAGSAQLLYTNSFQPAQTSDRLIRCVVLVDTAESRNVVQSNSLSHLGSLKPCNSSRSVVKPLETGGPHLPSAQLQLEQSKEVKRYRPGCGCSRSCEHVWCEPD